MLQIYILIGLLFKASASQITGYGNGTAGYGGEVRYKCVLADPTGVLQVTWQRLFKDDSIENLATYSKRFGLQVNEPYVGKVILAEASLTSTSILVKNVTWEDESCYICSFNVYPDGSKRKKTCLTVQGISKVNTGVQLLRSEDEERDQEEVVFSCSATGKPAPTIEWVFSTGATKEDQLQSTVANSDHTFTSSRNITLKVPLDWKGHVDCMLNRGMIGQRRERIPFSPSLRNIKQEVKGLSQSGVAVIVCAMLLISCIAVVAGTKFKRSKGNTQQNNTCTQLSSSVV
ncbi:OX-2 membrane glycoprotein-like [Dicentrarchus labrax]|uniref:Ig-like domain-containing protein n=1 Tax=Dicentrarchus labrax TaxID=13489 RepID=A0A8C4GGX4_DICLA|nr:OX-2 membrane glycoprotein-like [Dicentrarchus labrax]